MQCQRAIVIGLYFSSSSSIRPATGIDGQDSPVFPIIIEMVKFSVNCFVEQVFRISMYNFLSASTASPLLCGPTKYKFFDSILSAYIT